MESLVYQEEKGTSVLQDWGKGEMAKWKNGRKEKGEGIKAETRENMLSSCSISSFILFALILSPLRLVKTHTQSSKVSVT